MQTKTDQPKNNALGCVTVEDIQTAETELLNNSLKLIAGELKKRGFNPLLTLYNKRGVRK